MKNKPFWIDYFVFLTVSCVIGTFSKTNGLIIATLGAAYMICSTLYKLHDKDTNNTADDTDD